MPEVKTIQANEKLENIIEIIESDGCVVIENAISETHNQKLRQELEAALSQTPKCQGEFYGYETKRMSGLFTKSETCQDMAILPFVLGVMDHFLLKGCDQYQINLTQAISIGPGEEAQIIHQDDPMFPFMHPGQEAMINCMWAVTDFTKENGATQLVPGSHKWERSQVIDPEKMRLPTKDEITYGEMKAGSVLIYLGSLYHGGGANTTDLNRLGVVISYSLGWLRQAENNYLAYSAEEVRNMPERLQRLLGYFVHQPNLGSVFGMDPLDFLNSSFVHKKSSDPRFDEFIQDETKELIRSLKENKAKAA